MQGKRVRMWLRLAVYEGDQALLERVVRPGTSVTLGSSARCTVSLHDRALPSRLRLLDPCDVAATPWELVPIPGLQGELGSGGEALSPIEAGAAYRSSRPTPLPANARGQLSLHGLAIHLEAVPPPAAVARSSAYGLSRFDNPFWLVLVVSIALHTLLLGHALRLPPPRSVELTDIPHHHTCCFRIRLHEASRLAPPPLALSDSGGVGGTGAHVLRGGRADLHRVTTDSRGQPGRAAARIDTLVDVLERARQGQGALGVVLDMSQLPSLEDAAVTGNLHLASKAPASHLVNLAMTLAPVAPIAGAALVRLASGIRRPVQEERSPRWIAPDGIYPPSSVHSTSSPANVRRPVAILSHSP